MTALEKAAKALWDAGEEMQPERCRMRWEDGTHLARLTAVNRARAVLMAVREPGEAAVEAYFDKCREMGFTAHINASCAMETMIDAILIEEAA